METVTNYQLNNVRDVHLQTIVTKHSVKQPRLYRGTVFPSKMLNDRFFALRDISAWSLNKNISYMFMDRVYESLEEKELEETLVPVLLILDEGEGCPIAAITDNDYYPEEEEILINNGIFEIVELIPFEENGYQIFEIYIKMIKG